MPVLIAAGGVTGCGAGSDADTAPVAHVALPAVLERLVADRRAPPDDVIEVWVCDVPTDTTDPRYGELPIRVALTPEWIAAQISVPVGDYFSSISHASYRPSFVAGATIAMAATDTAETCVERALDASSPAATTVLAVATAEHTTGEVGGWGRPGSWFECTSVCPAAVTRRAAYVGASDFGADHQAGPLLDLIEHEIGHTLGLPHSGIAPDGSYISALDLMSNSAAPRELARSGASGPRDAPDTLAVNRLDLGWLPIDAVQVITPPTGAVVELSTSTGTTGTRLATFELDAHRAITIELLTAEGWNQHLPRAGVAVHLVDDRGGVRELRMQQPLGSESPHTSLLQPGDELTVEGWRIEVLAMGATAHLAVAPTEG